MSPDLFTATRPLYQVARVLGLAPFSCDNQNFHTSRWNMAYSFGLFCFLLAELLYLLFHQIRALQHVQLAISIPFITSAAVPSLVTLVSILRSFTNRRTIQRLLLKLGECDRVLNSPEGDIYVYVRHFVVAKISLVIAVELILSSVFLVLLFSVTELLQTVHDFIFNVCNSIMAVQFINVVFYLENRFAILNEQLLKAISREKENYREDFLSASSQQQRRVVAELRQVHQMLCQVTAMLSSYFGPQLLALFTTSLIHIVLSCFSLVQMVSSRVMEEQAPKMLCFVVKAVFLLVSVVLCCERTVGEAKRTAAIVNQGLLTARQSLDELCLFSQQLLLHKVRFSTCGVLRLEAALLPRFIGAVVTNFLLLTLSVHFQH